MEGQDFTRSFVVGDERTMVVVLDRRWADIGGDLVASGHDVAANLCKLTDVESDLVLKREVATAELTAWKARKYAAALASDAKTAEWKVREVVKSDPQYLIQARYIAQLKADLVWVGGLTNALERKISLIRGFIESDEGSRRATSIGLGGSPTPRIPDRLRNNNSTNDDEE